MLSSNLSRDCRQDEDSNEADNKEDLNAGHFSGEIARDWIIRRTVRGIYGESLMYLLISCK